MRQPQTLFSRSSAADTSNPPQMQDADGLIQEAKLNNLVDRSNRVLVRASSVFPFKFFPDTITVDETKINIVSRLFFGSQSVFTVPIKNVKTVVVTSNPLLANVEIQVSTLDPAPNAVKFLHIGDAYRIRRIIMGLVACMEDKINLDKFDSEDLVDKIEEIGRTRAA